MHEMGHSLNFSGLMTYGSYCGGSNYGCWGMGTGSPGIYDRFTENGAGQPLISAFANSSAALGAQLTGNNLYFDGANANAANGGSRVKIYAPSPGSRVPVTRISITTPSGTRRTGSWCTPSVGLVHPRSRPVTMGLLKDLGWTTVVNNPCRQSPGSTHPRPRRAIRPSHSPSTARVSSTLRRCAGTARTGRRPTWAPRS